MKKRQNYCVYVHIAPNGKLYIGMTGMKPTSRWNNGKGYLKCKLFYRAIEKYGWDNIKHIVLLEGLSCEIAQECEKALIRKYHTNNEAFGYNLTAGGEGKAGYKYSEEQRQAISDRLKGHPTSEETRRKIGEANKKALTGRKLSPEHVQHMREGARGVPHKPIPADAIRRMAEKQKGNHYHLGHKASEDTRKRMSEAHKGKPLPENVKQILAIKLAESRLDPIKEAQRREKIRQGHLGKKKVPWSDEARAAHMAAIQRRKQREQVVSV